MSIFYKKDVTTMPGQGFHLAVAKSYNARQGREMTDEFVIGTLVPDSWNSVMEGRRFSHFCGGGGCAIPSYDKLATLRPSKVKKWDSKKTKSYILDPPTDLKLFSVQNIHGGDYGLGLECHYVTDFLYDRLIQESLFNVSKQDEGFLIHRKTGQAISGAEFRQAVDKLYPVLDQLAYQLAGVTERDVIWANGLVMNRLPHSQAEFLCRHLRYDESLLPWPDLGFFIEEDFKSLFEQCVEFHEFMMQLLRRPI